VARAEAVEAAAATEIAADCGNTSIDAAVEAIVIADQAVALLTGLIRR